MQRPVHSDAWRPSTLLLVAVAAGLLTGLAEASFLHLQRLALGRIVFVGRHAFWMKPLAEAALFLIVTAMLLVLSRPLGARARARLAVSVIAGLSALSLLLLVPQIHLIARALLAAGIGYQIGRWVKAGRAPRERKVRGSAFGFVVLATVAGGALMGFGSRATVPASPARANAPSVLLLVLDTVRARSLSLYGHPKPTTSTLERIAAEGLLFERAIAPAPWTLPSHASMFTGREAHQLSADWRRPLDDTHPTLAEALSAAGYRTAGFVANMGYAGWETGLDRGFQRYEDNPISIRQWIVESSIVRWLLGTGVARRIAGRDENFVRKSAREVNDAFLQWLDDEADGPFFAFLNYYDAHGPYQPPEPFRSALADGAPRGGVSPLHRWLEDPFQPPPSEEQMRRELWAYEASIAYIDAQIGRLVDELERRDALSNTILIVTSDHGEEFGERGAYDHGNSLYLDGLHVPLVIRYTPAVPAGARVGTTVSTRRIAATIAELAGLGASFEGPSLLTSLTEAGRSGTPVLSHVSFAPRLPDWFPVSRGDMSSLTSDDWHFIRNGDGDEEIYRITSRPLESADLSGEPDVRAVADSLGGVLDALLRTGR